MSSRRYPDRATLRARSVIAPRLIGEPGGHEVVIEVQHHAQLPAECAAREGNRCAEVASRRSTSASTPQSQHVTLDARRRRFRRPSKSKSKTATTGRSSIDDVAITSLKASSRGRYERAVRLLPGLAWRAALSLDGICSHTRCRRTFFRARDRKRGRFSTARLQVRNSHERAEDVPESTRSDRGTRRHREVWLLLETSSACTSSRSAGTRREARGSIDLICPRRVAGREGDIAAIKATEATSRTVIEEFCRRQRSRGRRSAS